MMDRVGRRSWVATPLLLAFAGLPMLRATNIPGHMPMSTLGLFALMVLALKAFKDRAMSPLKVARRKVIQVHHEIPFLGTEVMRESPSGSHPRL
jgi:hypothetical protein